MEFVDKICVKDVILLLKGLPEGKGDMARVAVEALNRATELE